MYIHVYTYVGMYIHVYVYEYIYIYMKHLVIYQKHKNCKSTILQSLKIEKQRNPKRKIRNLLRMAFFTQHSSLKNHPSC